jgi:hypothetical protein
VRVIRHEYDLARLGPIEQAVSLVSIIQGKRSVIKSATGSPCR